MTVEIGRKTIVFGIETAVIVALFLITTTAGAVKYFVDAGNDRATINKAITEIKASQNLILGRDSVFISRLANVNRRVDSVAASSRMSLFYEFRTKNGIILKPVK